MEECEGRIYRDSEAKRVRAKLHNLRLDNHTNGREHRNNVRGCVKRLAELESISSESTCVDMLINQVTNPDCDHVVETLKRMESLTLLKCYFHIINKAVDLEKSQLGGIKHRNLKINMDMNMDMNIDEREIINLSDYA